MNQGLSGLPTPLAVLVLAVIMLAGLAALYGLFTRSRKGCSEGSPTLENRKAPVAPRSFFVRTVGDFLALVGTRIMVGTKDDKWFSGLLHDLSDSGTHIILKDVQENPDMPAMKHHDQIVLPISNVNFVQVVDRHGKMP